MPAQFCLAHLLCIWTCKLIIAGNINLVVINHTGRSKEIALKWVIIATLSDCSRCNLLASWCVRTRLLAGILAHMKVCKLLCTIGRILYIYFWLALHVLFLCFPVYRLSSPSNFKLQTGGNYCPFSPFYIWKIWIHFARRILTSWNVMSLWSKYRRKDCYSFID